MLDPALLLRDCVAATTRRGGPGGQHRNKVETAVVLTHRPTGLTAQAAERRSQAENHRQALFRLRIELALHHRTPLSSAELTHSPSVLWRSRCSGGRLSINPRHEDFLALLAEALDVLAAVEWDVSRAATLLNVTATQLVKLLRLEPRALGKLNEQRAARGLGKLV